MWVGVTNRFSQFGNAILPDRDEIDNVNAIAGRVAESLNRSYYGENRPGQNFQIVGSRFKDTAIIGLSDIDLYYLPPPAEFDRFNDHAHNGQSAFLQDLKDRLTVTFPTTSMRGDGQVVTIRFNAIDVELAPALIRNDNSILIPYTANGGKWIIATPIEEKQQLDMHDGNYWGNVRKFIRGVKVWADYCNVPLKSFWIEILVSEFAALPHYFKYHEYWFDWIYRDFFQFLMTKRNTNLYVPATHETKFLGEAWFSKAESAHKRSLKACDYEKADLIADAGLEWQKIFGTRIPIYV